jgi:uncharacterized membrane protein
MLRRLKLWWHELQNSLWFVPFLFVLVSIALAVGLIELDGQVKDDLLRHYPRLFGAGAEGSRGMLTTIAGSMMTALSVSFSITLAALAQASSQYTPRILRNFMRSRPTQITLGILAGIFAYCLIVLRTVRGGDGIQFVPSLSVLGGFVLALLGVGALIYFIHHAAVSLQASHILAAIAEETAAAIDHLFPEELSDNAESEGLPALDSALAVLDWQPVPATRTGFVQSVDSEALLRFACTREVIVRLDCQIGDFVIAQTPLAQLARSGPPTEEIRQTLNEIITINRYRTVEQDAGFGIRQIVDVALKALSPGINDTTTAVTCVDYLTAILVRLAPRRIPSPYRYQHGRLRVIATGQTFEELLEQALTQIRNGASGNLAVILRLLRCLETVAANTVSHTRRQALSQQLAMLTELIERGPHLTLDQRQLETARAQAAAALNQPAARRHQTAQPGARL